MKRVVAALLVLALPACSQGEDSAGAVNEPFRIRNAQFFSGKLPGTAPVPQGTAANKNDDLPSITNIALNNFVVTQGQGGKHIAGQASTNAWSIGLALDGVGSGYWTVPAGDFDPGTGALAWSATADFDESVPVGPKLLRLVVLDRKGVAGPQSLQRLCVASNSADGVHPCDPNTPPPAAAISLTWDSNVDLDLQVQTPKGIVVSPKHPLLSDGKSTSTSDTVDPSTPHIDRDSGANCSVDTIHEETLLWPDTAPKGLYRIYVNLFDPCKRPNARFRVAIYTAETTEDGGTEEKEWFSRSGELLDTQVGPASSLGLFVTEFKFK